MNMMNEFLIKENKDKNQNFSSKIIIRNFDNRKEDPDSKNISFMYTAVL